MSDVVTAMKKVAVFIPELKPLLPEIAELLAAGEKVQAILGPALKRVENKQPAFIEFGEALPELEPIITTYAPRAINLSETLRGIIADYERRLEQA